jgi:hypothetical protein
MMRRTRVLAAIVALVAGCWRDGPRATVAAVPAAAKVTDTATAKAAAGTQTQVAGTARSAKLAAVIVLVDGTPVYCLELASWPIDLEGATVVAEGTLETTEQFAAGAGEAGTNGAVWVLRDCKLAAP